MYTCPFCNKKLATRQKFSVHFAMVEAHRFTSGIEREKFIVEHIYGVDAVTATVESYKNGLICMNDIGRNAIPNIGRYIVLLGLKRTSKEERKTQRYIEKYTAAIQKKYGPGITNISQVKEIQLKKEVTVAKKHGSYANYLAYQRSIMAEGYAAYATEENLEKTYEKIKTTCLERYDEENFGKGPAAIAKRSISLNATVSSWSYEERLIRTSAAREAAVRTGGESSIERRVQTILSNNEIGFNKHVNLFNFNYDLLVEGNVLIEIQGDYWHANPAKYKASDVIIGNVLAADIWAKDAFKKHIAELNGYRLIALWEREIRSSTDTELSNILKLKIYESN